MKDRWVQDAKTTDVLSIITDMTLRNLEYIQKTGSQYVTGLPRSDNPDDTGIYFKDPTAND